MRTALITLLLLGLSFGAALLAKALGLPLPYLTGPLILSGIVAMGFGHALPDDYGFPPRLRLAFIAIIGLMIGAQVTPGMFAQPDELAVSFAAVALYVVTAHAFGYGVLRHLGRYDRATAFYGSAPGGMFESIALGEASGADPARLTLQQFLRIIVVLTLLPAGLSFWTGGPVGSAAGVTFARDAVSWEALAFVVGAGALGLALGFGLRLPAKQLTGPMAVAAVLSLTGLHSMDLPQWLINLAQVVVGCALGMRFKGLSAGLIWRAVGLTLVCVTGMLGLSVIFALALMQIKDQPFDVLLISFAPGGVTEMALVALSLSANPAYVTLHHVVRILFTVLGLGAGARILRLKIST